MPATLEHRVDDSDSRSEDGDEPAPAGFNAAIVNPSDNIMEIASNTVVEIQFETRAVSSAPGNPPTPPVAPSPPALTTISSSFSTASFSTPSSSATASLDERMTQTGTIKQLQLALIQSNDENARLRQQVAVAEDDAKLQAMMSTMEQVFPKPIVPAKSAKDILLHIQGPVSLA